MAPRASDDAPQSVDAKVHIRESRAEVEAFVRMLEEVVEVDPGPMRDFIDATHAAPSSPSAQTTTAIDFREDAGDQTMPALGRSTTAPMDGEPEARKSARSAGPATSPRESSAQYSSPDLSEDESDSDSGNNSNSDEEGNGQHEAAAQSEPLKRTSSVRAASADSVPQTAEDARGAKPERQASIAKTAVAPARAGAASVTLEWPPTLQLQSAAPATPEGSKSSAVRVFCCTWNLMGKSVPSQTMLYDLVPFQGLDIYAIATQECERSIAQSAVRTSKKSWETKLASFFTDRYAMLRSHTLQATHLAVFVRKELLPLLSNCGSAAVATGYRDTFGNKGGVGVSFSLGRTSFLFVASHLEAHQHRVRQRNEHFHRIDTQLALPPGTNPRKRLAGQRASARGQSEDAEADPILARRPSVRRAHSGSDEAGIARKASGVRRSQSRAASDPDVFDPDDSGSELSGDGGGDDDEDEDDDDDIAVAGAALPVDGQNATAEPAFGYATVPNNAKLRATCRFDRVFWLGDLNYRIDLPRTAVEAALQRRGGLEHRKLLASDQLRREMAAGRSFREFQEPPLNFPPTYKFDKNSDAYDSSKKQRVPAWTDRILHRGTSAGAIEPLHYASVPGLRISDHRPVQAVYRVQVEGRDDSTLVGLGADEIGTATSQVCAVM